MSRSARILGPNGEPFRVSGKSNRSVRSRYDAASESSESRNWWAQADGLSANAANSPEIREKLRNRCRYEAANNSWCNGIAATLADYLIGDGPKLQVTTENTELNRAVEAEWSEWSDAVGFAEKLWIMRRARAVDGEVFLQLYENPSLDTPSVLDLQTVEADRVATPYLLARDIGRAWVDGIEIDSRGNRIAYHVLRDHPGDDGTLGNEYDRIPARDMIHWFRGERPGQARGVSEFTPALDQFAQLRRYCMAVIAAAETAAEFAVLLQSDLSADTEEEDNDASNAANITPFTSTEIVRRMMTTLPAGYTASQMKAEQPTTTHGEFVRSKIAELARCLQMPYAIAAGDYSQSNYSSGRLDVQNFNRSIKIDRARLERRGLDRVFSAWMAEMTAIRVFPRSLGRVPHQWLWPGMEHVDPLKEANATATQLGNYLTTFSEECHKQGVDPEARGRLIKADLELFKKLGIPDPYTAPATSPAGSPAVDPRDEEAPAGDAAATRQSYSPSRNGRH